MAEYNKYTQLLMDIDKGYKKGKRYRLVDTDGNEYVCIPDCWTYVTIGDDEDVDALRFFILDDAGKVANVVTLAGQWIAKYEEIQE